MGHDDTRSLPEERNHHDHASRAAVARGVDMRLAGTVGCANPLLERRRVRTCHTYNAMSACGRLLVSGLNRKRYLSIKERKQGSDESMKVPRRKLLRLAAGAAVLPAVCRGAMGQDYPARALRLVVGFPPGTAPDVAARLIGQRLSEQLGRSVIIENHVGASSNLAAELVVRAPPNGYTLFELTSVNSWNVALFDNLRFDLIHDLVPIASIYRGFGVVVVQPSFAARTLVEFIDYAKANPGKLRMGSGGIGTPQHLYGEMFKQMCGIDMLHVPYRGGGRALTDLLGGHVDVLFDTLVTSIEHIRSNELRALGVTSPTRIDVLPNVPAVAEVVPEYAAEGWQGIAAPANTPAEIIDKLNKEINAGLADPKIKARLADLGATVFLGSPPTSASSSRAKPRSGAR
jgi:tripartite-type tricarboxylate transporter receptor subunit TctC